MRFARDVSSRVFYMDRGELWEAGPPEQIFEHPERKETHDFIFRVRSWTWEVNSLDYDYPAMIASLGTFCERQFLTRKTAMACRLVVEEIVAEHLVPTARSRGIANPDLRLQMSVAEGGEEVSLAVDCTKMVAKGVDLQAVADSADDLTLMLVRSYAPDLDIDKDGILTCTIR